jgi:preprotein translocase subunit SecB
MKIKLDDTRVISLNIEQSKADDVLKDDFSGEMTGFETSLGLNPDDRKKYVVKFDMEIKTSCLSVIRLEYIGCFSTDEEVDDNFVNSGFARVNSPAIAYPYLRAYISNLLTLSGYETIILPTVNFQAMFNSEKVKAKELTE